MREYEYAAVLQGKILDKYGPLHGISKDLVLLGMFSTPVEDPTS